jgi:hypothetical protein
VFVIEVGNAEAAVTLRNAGLARIAADRRFQVYGPCRSTVLPAGRAGMS